MPRGVSDTEYERCVFVCVRVCVRGRALWLEGHAQEEIGLLTFMRNDRRVSGRAAVCHLSSSAHLSLLSLFILRLCSHFRLHFLAPFDESFPRPFPVCIFSSMKKTKQNKEINKNPPAARPIKLSDSLAGLQPRPEIWWVRVGRTDGRSFHQTLV